MSDEELYMVRADLERLPSYALPPRFAIRWHAPGDEDIWVALQAPFYDPGAVTDALFRQQFGVDPHVHSQRIAYLLDPTGQPVGTAAAWSYDGFREPTWGRVHWVALAAAHQGRGLSKPLLSTVLDRLAGLGHTHAYLTTSRTRPVAIRLYERFGFVALSSITPR